jgi:hypothetical protein
MTTYGDFQLPFYGVIHNRNLYFPNAKINQPNKQSISLKNIINSRLPTKNPYKSNFGKFWYPQMDIDSSYNSSKGGYSYGPMGPYFATGLGNYPRSMYKKVKFGAPNLNDPPPKGHKENIVINTRHIIPSHVLPQDLSYYINDILNKKKYGRNIAVPGDTIFYSRVTSDYPGYKAYTWEIIQDPNNPDNMTTKQVLFFGKSNRKKRKSPKRKIVYCLPNEQKYPVNTKKKCSAALSYARYAPDPCKIARCVSRNCKKYPNVGKYSKLMKECKSKSKKK